MITFFIELTILSVFISHFMVNPVSLSLNIVLSSFLFFFSMYIMSGHLWFSFMFFLLFMGGILIMFLILSSLMPNEVMEKIKMSKVLFLTLMFFYFYNMKIFSFNLSMMKIKLFLSSNLNMMMLTFLILMYFLGFMIFLSKHKSPVRLFSCY